MRLYRARYTKVVDGRKVVRQCAKWYAKLKAGDAWKAFPLSEDEETSRRMVEELKKKLAQTGRVYFIRCGEYVKIGFTFDLRRRLKELRAASPVPMEVLHSFAGTEAEEKLLHVWFAAARVPHQREWFRLTPEIVGYLDYLGGGTEPAHLAGVGEALLHWEPTGGAA